MTLWLIESGAWKSLQAQRKNISFAADQVASFEAKMVGTGPDAATGLPRNLSIAGNIAQIDVTGVLTKKPDIFAYYFGGGNTTYATIESALSHALVQADVKKIQLNIDSPGGQVDGLFELLAKIQAVQSSKPMSVRSNLAASAAYAIAAVAGPIQASSPASTFGSIGVVSTYFVEDDVIDITSTDSPNKRPDPTTSEGQAVIRAYLDELYDLFVDAVAKGRGIKASDVTSTFGAGAVFTAKEAKSRGMIDSYMGALRAVPKSSTVAHDGESEKPMDLKTLKAQHPELVEALKKEGAAEELDRVSAHLIMGEAVDDMKTAIAAIKEGKPMTATLQAQYAAAGLAKRDKTARTEDDKTVAAATQTVAGAAPTRDIGDAVADALGAPTLEKK